MIPASRTSVDRSASVVIVGAGHAGARAAMALRQGGFTDSIMMLTAEPEFPYERPPLSKEYLSGEKLFEALLIRPYGYWAEQRVEVLRSCRVVTVDPSARCLTTSDGMRIGYRELIWAAGGEPRRLPCSGRDLQGVHSVRTRADVDRIREELDFASRVVVIGGGYIGLEAAAVLRKLGKHVVVLEACERVLSRVAGPEVSRFFSAAHRAHGVEVRTSCAVEDLVGERGRVCSVRLRTGELIPADLVIVGIGITPVVRALLAAGAEGTPDGVRIDSYCRTSLPGIHAIGDCTLHANRWADGALIRLESVQNAADQANVAVKDILGTPVPYDTVPWFWSN